MGGLIFILHPMEMKPSRLLIFHKVYIKQGYWIILSILLIIVILSIEAKFYERFAGLIYVFSLLSLLGLFVFGKNVSGATSWYSPWIYEHSAF